MAVLRALVDINAYVDSLTKRQPFAKDADALLRANDKGQFTAYVAAFSVPIMFYLVRRELSRSMGQAQATKVAFNDIDMVLSNSEICNVDRVILERAMQLGREDYEDNLQLACALAYNLDVIVTRDKKFRSGAIEFLTPTDLLKRIRRK